MLTFFETSPDILAVRQEGRFEKSDLDAYVDRLVTALEGGDRIHLFAEVIGFNGVDIRGVAESFGRWASILGNLKKLGRIAIVSDAVWMRWAARIESALLPHISYETFRPEEREIALAWVKGERSNPHGRALTLIDTGNPQVLGFELDGKITAAEIHDVSEHFRSAIESGQPLRLLGRIKHIGGIELEGLNAEYFGMKRELLARLERYAIVGGPAWLCSWVRLLDGLTKAELRHFPAEDEAAAWDWLGVDDVQQRRVA